MEMGNLEYLVSHFSTVHRPRQITLDKPRGLRYNGLMDTRGILVIVVLEDGQLNEFALKELAERINDETLEVTGIFRGLMVDTALNRDPVYSGRGRRLRGDKQ